MEKKKLTSLTSEELTGEQIARQIAINYESILQANINIGQLTLELNRREQELKKDPIKE